MVIIAIVIIIVIVAAVLIVIVIIEVVIIVTPKTLKESSPVPIEKLAAISQHGIRQHHYSTCCCKEYDKSSGGFSGEQSKYPTISLCHRSQKHLHRFVGNIDMAVIAGVTTRNCDWGHE